ncbi:AMP-binding protein [Thalassotalea euphylliae]|uniref:AMP-binding protein n=1 Tax=Thalassotalea euphylliae TaxID=1655234 RepID=UPI0036366920
MQIQSEALKSSQEKELSATRTDQPADNLTDEVARPSIDASQINADQLPPSVYHAIQQAATSFGDSVAIKYILNGNALGPKNIPFKQRAIHQAIKLLKGKTFAQPYREITYKQLASQVTQVANALKHLSLSQGGVTSLLLPNFPETYSALWGAETAGIANPINPMLESDIIAEIMSSAQSEVLIALGPVPGSDIWPKVMAIKDKVPSLKAVISLFGDDDHSSGSVPVYGFHQLLEKVSSNHLACEPPSQQDTAAYFHTGGTTGLPKLAMQSHLNQLSNAAQVNLVLPTEQGDTMLVGLPIFHVNAANATGLGSITKGATILMTGPAGFRSAEVVPNLLTLLNHFNVSIMMAVPTVYASIVEQLSEMSDTKDLDISLKIAISGAAPLSPALKHKFSQLTKVPLIEGYGATETTAVSTLMPIKDNAVRQSVGLPLPLLDLQIADIDESGNLVGFCDTDQVGEIVVSGPNIFKGYLEQSHNDQSWLVDSTGKRYFRTGDLGRLDKYGYLALAGRQKELIIRGGHNIDPKMIEDTASKHPDVSLAAAVGRPDAYAGEVPVLYVTLKENHNVSGESVLSFVTEHIQERAATPKQVIVLDDMPTTAIGKIFKPQLNCFQVESVIKTALTDVEHIAGVEARPSKQHGILATINVYNQPDKVQNDIDDALANFALHYCIEYIS